MLVADILKIISFALSGFFSFCLLAFSFVMLGLKSDDKVVYYSIISSIISLWSPSPVSIITGLKSLKSDSKNPDPPQPSSNGVELV